MKKFIAILILILTFQTPSWADDISDFQIEGMSLGDSLLDYVSEREILVGPYYPKSKKFIMIKTKKSSEVYDDLQFHTKRGDKKYITESIEGIFEYENNFKDCYKKMDEVVNDLTEMFKNITRKEKIPLEASYGEGTEVNFTFNSGDAIAVSCNNYKEKYKNFVDNLKISLQSKEFIDWISYEAF